MKAIMASSGGRAPPSQNKQTPCAGSQLGFAGAVTRAQRQCASWWSASDEQKAVDESIRGIWCCPGGRRRSGNLRGPQFVPDQGESVAEGRRRLGVPVSALEHRSTLDGKLAGPQGHEGEQREERRRAAQDGEVGPLAF